jgi:ADP-heptose:LPS heptosyltransferase
MSRAVETPGSVLIYVASDSPADGLVKLPFARALRNAFPSAEITWLAGKGTSAYAHSLAPLVGGLIDEVVEEAGIGRQWSELLKPPLSGTRLAGRRFDLIIDTQRQFGTALLLKRIPTPCFISGAADYLLSDRRPPRPRRKQPTKVRQMLRLAELASGQPTDIRGEPPDDPQLNALAARLLPEGCRYVGLAPGAGSEHKRWPLQRYLELGAAQLAAGHVPVVFLGPEEGHWALPVREALPQALLPLQAEAVARLGPSPLVTIALARRLAVAVANDAGIGHMMAAANCPLVCLFGPTAPERSAPLVPRAQVLCAQSYGGEAMENIPLAAVRNAVDCLLEGTTEDSAAKARPAAGRAVY